MRNANNNNNNNNNYNNNGEKIERIIINYCWINHMKWYLNLLFANRGGIGYIDTQSVLFWPLKRDTDSYDSLAVRVRQANC